MSACPGFSVASFITFFRCLPANVRHFITSMTSCTFMQGWWSGIFYKSVFILSSPAVLWTEPAPEQHREVAVGDCNPCSVPSCCLNLPSLPAFGFDGVPGTRTILSLHECELENVFPAKSLAAWSPWLISSQHFSKICHTVETAACSGVSLVFLLWTF